MLNSLRRIYFYVVVSVVLFFELFAIQGVVYALLRSAGLEGAYVGVPDTTALPDAIRLLVIALVIVAPVGVLHYWFIRRDASEDAVADRGVVRELTLDLLTISFATTTIIAAASLVYNQFQSVNGDPYYATNSANNLATALTYGLGLGALIYERLRTTDHLPVARGISLTLAYLQQFSLLIALMVTGSAAIQSVVDAASPSTNFCGSDCFYVEPTPASRIGQALVILLGLAGYQIWTRRDERSIFRQIADGVFLIVSTITAAVGVVVAVQFVLALIQGASSTGFPFQGPLVVGVGALIFFFVRVNMRAAGDQQPRQIALVALALPLVGFFLVGLIGAFTGIFLLGSTRAFDQSQWNGVGGAIVAGAAWVALWPTLARMSDPKGNGPAVPRRVYVLIVLGSTLLGAVIALAVALYNALTALTDPTRPADQVLESTAFATTLVLGVTTAYYIYVLARDQRVLRAHPAAALAQPVVTQPTVEDILAGVASGSLSPEEGARLLKPHLKA